MTLAMSACSVGWGTATSSTFSEEEGLLADKFVIGPPARSQPFPLRTKVRMAGELGTGGCGYSAATLLGSAGCGLLSIISFCGSGFRILIIRSTRRSAASSKPRGTKLERRIISVGFKFAGLVDFVMGISL